MNATAADFCLDPAVTYLNHGGFGAAPRVVLEAQQRYRDAAERNPTAWMESAHDRLDEALEPTARLLGADVSGLVFVDNATTAINAVLSHFPLEPGDEVLVTSHVYPGVRGALMLACQRTGAKVVEARVPFPIASPDQAIEAVREALGPRTKLAIVDHITSGTGLVLPVAELVAACHDAGVPVAVDGAHAPGQVPVDVGAINAEWYTGNNHKWAMAPRPCAVLHVREDWRDRTWPAIGSLHHFTDWRRAFHWPGTHDASAWLASADGLRWYEAQGIEAVMARNNALALQAAALLSAAWDCEVPSPPGMRAALVTLPAPGRWEGDQEGKLAMRAFLRGKGIEAPGFPHAGRLWIRVSAQLYNTLDDYRVLAEALA